MNNKVVVTGFDMVTALGLGWQETWEGLLNGKSGVAPIRLFDASENETRFAAQLPESFEEYAATKIKKRIRRQMTRVTQMAYVCAEQAIEQSRIDIEYMDRSRVGVIMGIVNTGDSSTEQGTTSKNMILKRMNNAVPAWIALKHKFEGPSYAVSSACSSSAFAIAQAADLIRLGRIDMAIVGGADSIINKEEIEGFNQLYAISTKNDDPEKASAPFSKNRDGFVIGEGTGILILESEASARKRGAKIFAKLSGYGLTTESFNIMAPKKDGEGMARTMTEALKDADLTTNDIDYINAHGTSTTLNDLYETMAVKTVFGKQASKLVINSTKSMIGHTIGAAGVIEAVVSILSLMKQEVHPTINLNEPDPDLNLDYVPEGKRPVEIKNVLSNSFAFGGHNASLIFSAVQ